MTAQEITEIMIRKPDMTDTNPQYRCDCVMNEDTSFTKIKIEYVTDKNITFTRKDIGNTVFIHKAAAKRKLLDLHGKEKQ